MDISIEDLTERMLEAGKVAFKDGWKSIQTYAPGEFRKMAVQIEDIAHNVAAYEIDDTQGYSPETGRILFKMQRRALEGVLVALTKLTLIAVQNALNAVFQVVGALFDGVLKTVLL